MTTPHGFSHGLWVLKFLELQEGTDGKNEATIASGGGYPAPGSTGGLLGAGDLAAVPRGRAETRRPGSAGVICCSLLCSVAFLWSRPRNVPCVRTMLTHTSARTHANTIFTACRRWCLFVFFSCRRRCPCAFLRFSQVYSTEITASVHLVARFLTLRRLCCKQALQGAFTDVLEGTVRRDSFLFKWLDYLSFALR